MLRSTLCALFLSAAPLAAADRAELLVADFEGASYGTGWTTTGTAFGKGPARGTLSSQMPVSGYLGKGLVNSYLDGDASTGTLTSPEITIERKYINFLIGGGKHPGKTCINMLIGGKVVRTATGPNDQAGGSEHLDWHTWNVGEYEGKGAVIQIVDDEKGGWGHINVDHIVQSDARKQAEVMSRTFHIAMPYLHLPVKTGEPKRRMKFVVGNETVREFDIELATDGKPDFWATADVAAFAGKKLTVEILLPSGVKLANLIVPSDIWASADPLYTEAHRPLFHFTSRVGWLNDPNGLVYADGQWHLFYQHNPFGREWGNMHWGHATSPDLLRWTERGVALYPRKYDDWAFSGSAVLDVKNTSGWGTKEKPPLVLAYTSTGRGECIAHSSDDGRTWTEYDRNPVLKHAGRDPKLVWYEKGKHWVMAVYDEFEGKQWIAFHTSADLKEWKFASRIEGFFECPDLFAISTRSDQKDAVKWVLYAADGKYLIGDFDGKTFRPDFKEKKRLWHGNFYAAQSFDNAPRSISRLTGSAPGAVRRVQIGWANGVTFPGTPFNQQMTIPVELDLLSSEKDGGLLIARPVPELESLRDGQPVFQLRGQEQKTTAQPFELAQNLDAFEVELSVEMKTATGFTLDLRGTKLVYDAAKDLLTCNGVTAPLKAPKSGDWVVLRVLVDRGSVEVFSPRLLGWSTVAMSVAALPNPKNGKLAIVPHGGEIVLSSTRIYRMKSSWTK